MPQTLTGSSPICDRARVSKNRRHGYFQLRDTCLRSYMPRVRSMTVWPIRLPSCHCRSTKRGLQRSAYECRRWQNRFRSSSYSNSCLSCSTNLPLRQCRAVRTFSCSSVRCRMSWLCVSSGCHWLFRGRRVRCLSHTGRRM